MKWVIYLSLLIVVEAIADILAKEYQINKGVTRFIGAISLYVLANIFWLVALRNGAGLTKGSIIFSVASAILAIFIGLFLYKESLTNLQIVGVVLGFISIVFLVWE